jgi:hypothetical protein
MSIADQLAVVVPSRKRSHNMLVLCELLPSALICIDEREVDDYSPVVSADRLLLHPPLKNAPACRNWIVKNVATSIVVMIDDDFVGVQVMVGSHRFITSADEIMAIIENAARCCADLSLGVFCFAGTQNGMFLRADERPIAPVQPVFRAFGVMGSARERTWRVDIRGRADADYTLRTLLLDRCVFADTRFFFDCGKTFSGRGGNVGMITPEQFEESTRELKRTWGRSISFKAPGYVKKREVAVCSIKVSRANKVAQR